MAELSAALPVYCCEECQSFGRMKEIVARATFKTHQIKYLLISTVLRIGIKSHLRQAPDDVHMEFRCRQRGTVDWLQISSDKFRQAQARE